ncbi:galactose-binding domain-like protein [Chytriomyces cf. hyalinus JEL632]|nr:galactose-binding domain-like protein [Chytriomyces cf. hyalinus JEL632]
MASIINTDVKIKVSSTLNKDSKSFGKQYLTDGDLETCWNSDQGTSQWIISEFPRSVCPSQVVLMFQGGFSSSQVLVYGAPTPLASASPDWTQLTHLYPEDSNNVQTFDLASSVTNVRSLKFVFTECSDTYGRIVVYRLDVLGTSEST